MPRPRRATSSVPTAGGPRPSVSSAVCPRRGVRAKGGFRFRGFPLHSGSRRVRSYIKELADRIHSIEGKLGNQALRPEGPDSRRDSGGAYSPTMQLNDNSKRPFSSISADALSAPVANRLSGWASDPRTAQPQPAANYLSDYASSRLSARPGEDAGSSRPVPVPDGFAPEAEGKQLRGIED